MNIDDVVSIHADQIENHGGPEGIRDLGLVEGAIDRPRQLFHYDGVEDPLVLSVRLGIAIAKAHGFVDGNKRTGAFAMIEFLAINGFALRLPNTTWLGEQFELVVTDGMGENALVDTLDLYVIELA